MGVDGCEVQGYGVEGCGVEGCGVDEKLQYTHLYIICSEELPDMVLYTDH